MRSFQTYAAAAALAATVAVASDVHQLKTDTFGPFIQENDLVLAECTLEQAAKLFMVFGRADCC